MSTIFLDPVRMDATAGAIGEHVTELTTLTADLETACSAPVPASIAGWLADELHDVALHVRMVALLYSLAALDMASRAHHAQGNQSLVTAVPSLATTAPAFADTPLADGFVLGLPGSSSYVPPLVSGSGFVLGLPAQLDTDAAGSGWMLRPPGTGVDYGNRPQLIGGFGTSGGPSLADAIYRPNNMIANDVAPQGLDARGPGNFVDGSGHSGPIGAAIRDPETGELRFP